MELILLAIVLLNTFNFQAGLTENEPVMHDLFRQLLTTGEATINPVPQSEDDKRALIIMEMTTRRIDGRFKMFSWWLDEWWLWRGN